MQETDSKQSRPRLIELGWLVVGEFDQTDLAVIHRAHEQMLKQVQSHFPEFDWFMPLVRYATPLVKNTGDVTQLLQEGLTEQDARHWDFTFVVTHADLTSYYKPYTLAVPSRALAVAVISLARLLPQSADRHSDKVCRAQRLCAIALHLLGDLNGVEHANASSDFMYPLRDVADLDAMQRYAANTQMQLQRELADIADIRLEEQPQAQTAGTVKFYLKGVWHLRDPIQSAVIQARPWEFPFRLSRLSTGAISALLVLLMTAEAWDLGMSQPLPLVTSFALLVLLGSTAFILTRQKLLLQRSRKRLSEQIVVNNIAISLIVLIGLATTFFALLFCTLALAGILFNHTLVVSWAASLGGDVSWSHYLAFAQLIASLGILIGSLGASFEGQGYIRHVAYVDEEL